ncbi:MAG: ABC transporter ATP-binding protein [Phycisphaerae bacterium]|nr:ABC transporter ATP-binding protein [Phycisphaerae bacterium]
MSIATREKPATPRALDVDGASRTPAISVCNLSKAYQIYARPVDRLKQALFRWKRRYFQDFWALRDISFEVARGQTLGIIGRNGSGKSTLLQVVAGILAPTGGEVRVEGRLSALLELGAGFNHEFTGRENVYLAAAVHGLSRQETRSLMPAIEEFADIGDFIDQPVKTYSSGMFVRLAFAVAAQVRPDILIVDEALAVGDIFFQQKCARFMTEQLASATKILVTHSMASVAAMCDRAIVLHKGRMVFDGPPGEAIEFYTKLVHTEEFSRGRGTAFGALAASGPSGAASAPAPMKVERVDETLPWVDVTPDDRGGAGEVVIERVALTDRHGRAAQAFKPGDPFTCHIRVRADRAKERIIFGAMVVDRFGKNVCGDNSLSSPGRLVDLPGAGRYHARLEYRWPDLHPGEYTVTFGVGEGNDPLQHAIQCWAHNVVAVSGISPGRPIHGLFTNPLRGFGFAAVEAGDAGDAGHASVRAREGAA